MSVPLYRPMKPRDPQEENRASTPLEAFFDLAVVAAVSAAASSLHTAMADGDVGGGLIGYLGVFFAIWWAWVNFTWFASAFDTEDLAMRLLTMVQMAGVLVLAAGVPRASNGNFTIVTFGYAIMRLALVIQWRRAQRESGDPEGICGRYWKGILLVQLLWLGRLALPPESGWWTFVVLMIAELLVPPYAERGSRSPWNAEHIAERYGLFVIIVCGEVILSASTSFRGAIEHGFTAQLIMLGVGALLIVFTLWSFYFQRDHSDAIRERGPWVWAYLHYFIFASIAAVGAGIQVMVGLAERSARLPVAGADLLLAGAIAVFLLASSAASFAVTGYRHELSIATGIAALVVGVGMLGRAAGTTTLFIGVLLVTVFVVNAIVSGRRAAADD